MFRPLAYTSGNILSLIRKQVLNQRTLVSCNQIILPVCSLQQPKLQILRYKSKGSKNKVKPTTDTESDENASDEIQDKHTRTLRINTTSLRIDAILKAALGISRNKIELMFYESRIRVNGEKITKKSLSVQAGDEIDLIKGVNISNPNF